MDQKAYRVIESKMTKTTQRSQKIYKYPSMHSLLGNSVVIPIIMIGVIAGIGSSFFTIYSFNVVGMAFERYRPIGLGIGGIGTAVGCLIMPPISNGLLHRCNY